MAAAIIESIAKDWSSAEKMQVLEIGAGTGGTTASLLPVLSRQKTIYTFTDISKFFTNQAKDKFSGYSFVNYGVLNIDKNPLEQNYESHSFDVIVAANVLHDAHHINQTLQYLRSLLAPGGLMIVLEATQNTHWQMVSVGFIEGFGNYKDERLHTNLPLLSVSQWQKQFSGSGFEKFVAFPSESLATEIPAREHVMVAQAPLEVEKFKPKELSNYLQNKLPKYMLPSVYIPLTAFPLTSNGKIDRKALPAPYLDKSQLEKTFVASHTSIEKKLITIWEDILGVNQVNIDDNFFELGGDSLVATRIISRIRDTFKLEFTLQKFFEALTIKNIAEYLEVVNQVLQVAENPEVYEEKIEI